MLLEEAHVQILSEFECNGVHHADLGKTVFAVETQRPGVIGRDDGDDVLDAPLAAPPLDLRIKLLANAAVAAGTIHVDRKIGGAAVGATRIEHIQIGIADGLPRAVARDDVGIALRDARHTRAELLRCDRLFFERDAGVFDIVIITAPRRRQCPPAR